MTDVWAAIEGKIRDIIIPGKLASAGLRPRMAIKGAAPLTKSEGTALPFPESAAIVAAPLRFEEGWGDVVALENFVKVRSVAFGKAGGVAYISLGHLHQADEILLFKPASRLVE